MEYRSRTACYALESTPILFVDSPECHLLLFYLDSGFVPLRNRLSFAVDVLLVSLLGPSAVTPTCHEAFLGVRVLNCFSGCIYDLRLGESETPQNATRWYRQSDVVEKNPWSAIPFIASLYLQLFTLHEFYAGYDWKLCSRVWYHSASLDFWMVGLERKSSFWN